MSFRVILQKKQTDKQTGAKHNFLAESLKEENTAKAHGAWLSGESPVVTMC